MDIRRTTVATAAVWRSTGLPGAFRRALTGGRRLATPFVVLVLFLLACVVPMFFGADWAELHTAPDEAAHYVTSLMVRSYVLEAFGTDPRQFALEYYVRYPKVAFGIWPPLFHVALGAWLLVFGPSFAAAIAFVAFTTALVAFVIFRTGRSVLGLPLAMAAAVAFVTFPAVQAPATSVMMDMLCALFMLVAAVAFGRYMDHPARSSAILFGVTAGAALLTKYNAAALALLPPLALLIARRWPPLRRPDFWLMPLLVLVIAGPWYVTHLDMIAYASQPVPPLGAWKAATLENALTLSLQLGVLGIPLAVLGINEFCRLERRPVWCALLALLISVWLFHSLLYRVSVARYLLAPFAVLALFSAAGIHVSMTHLLPLTRVAAAGRIRAGAAILLMAVLVMWTPRPRPSRGFSEAASTVLKSTVRDDVTSLVSADPIGEGAYVAYVASHAPANREVIVLRGSKLLATGTWMGLEYAPRHQDTNALLTTLDRARVHHVVLDDSSTEPHHRLLHEAVRTSPAWMLTRRIQTSSGPVRIYTRVKPLGPGRPEFELDTKYSLGSNVRR